MYGYLPVFLGLFEPFGRDLTRSEGSLRSKHSRTKSPSALWPHVNWSGKVAKIVIVLTTVYILVWRAILKSNVRLKTSFSSGLISSVH